MNNPTPSSDKATPCNTRIIRRYESWPSDPGPSSRGWRWYIQVRRPRFFFFGALKWCDLVGPFFGKDQVDSYLAHVADESKLNKEEVVA